MSSILIVDDALFMRMVIKKALEPLGYTIAGEADNGRTVLDMVRRLRPDLMTLDIVMPEMDGLEVLSAVRQEFPDLRVIMVTAVDQRESMSRALRLGIDDFVVKPFDDNRIVSAVDRALARPHATPASPLMDRQG